MTFSKHNWNQLSESSKRELKRREAYEQGYRAGRQQAQRLNEQADSINMGGDSLGQGGMQASMRAGTGMRRPGAGLPGTAAAMDQMPWPMPDDGRKYKVENGTVYMYTTLCDCWMPVGTMNSDGKSWTQYTW